MDNLRFALLCALGVVFFFLYQAWQEDYAEAPRPEQTAEQQTAEQQTALQQTAEQQTAEQQVAETRAPETAATAGDDVPDFDAAPVPPDAAPAPAPTAKPDAPLPPGAPVHVMTDKLEVSIARLGGTLREVQLRDVPVANDRAQSSLNLLNDQPPNFFVLQSGLIGAQRSAPNHNEAYTVERSEYRLGEGEDVLEVPLTWSAPDGRRVTKVFTFRRDSYVVGLRHVVVNNSAAPWKVSPYLRLWRTPFQHAEEAPFAGSFMGVGWYQAEEEEDGYRFAKVAFDDLAENPLNAEQRGGWLAMLQHYFIGAVIPPADALVSYYAAPKAVPGAARPGFAAGYVGAATTVAPGAEAVFSTRLFLGPKLQDRLDDVAPGLGLTVDYGIFSFIAGPLFWVLEKLHAVVGNWGWAIVLLTVIIKLAFYKLSETQYRAMARMRKFAPRMQQLKEQYGDDRQKLQEKMMDLYKKEGFNPLGGCWPLLVQMPVFIALYWVLQQSVELRHADFMLWINDLSAPDPLYILPVAFGITMYLQQKLSAATITMDPIQQRMMQVMPVGLAVFFAFFPAGLVLYWLTNNLLSIAQQWYIYRKLDAEGLSQRAASK